MVSAISVSHLTYHYSQEKNAVLRDVSFSVRQGEVFGIIGPSGCGKSTLMLALSGLIPHSLHGDMHGTVHIEGKDTKAQSMAELSQQAQILFQSPDSQLFAEDLDAEIAFGPVNLGLNKKEVSYRVDEALHMTKLAAFRQQDPHALSVGQKRRVSLASVLAMKPEIIIVDEPDTGLDHKTARIVMNYLQKLNRSGKTIIMISHSLELLAEYCTRIVALKDSKLVPPEEVYAEYFTP